MKCCNNHDLWEQFTEEEPVYLRLGNNQSDITTDLVRDDPLRARSERAIEYWNYLATLQPNNASTMTIHAFTIFLIYLSF